jgi:hypothetical protein
MADADVWRTIAELERRLARLERRLDVDADAEPETMPGVSTAPGPFGRNDFCGGFGGDAPSESPVIDAVADGLEALGFFSRKD